MMSVRVYNVLFLCTGNSARSIIAEALMNHIGKTQFKAYSAGSHPKQKVHPLTLEVLSARGIPSDTLRSKSWDEFAVPGAPVMDFVFTVCDNAAGEACPVWPGQPITAHWGISDPVSVSGPDFLKQAAFDETVVFMRNRITAFLSLPLDAIDRISLSDKLKDIGTADDTDTSRLSQRLN